MALLAGTPQAAPRPGTFIPGNYRPLLGGEASAPVEIPIVRWDSVKDKVAPNPPGFTYSITANDQDTYNFVYTDSYPPVLSSPLITELRPDETTTLMVGVCEYPMNRFERRGASSSGGYVWDIAGMGIVLPKGDPYTGKTIFYNKYVIMNDRPATHVLYDPFVTINQTLIVKNTSP